MTCKCFAAGALSLSSFLSKGLLKSSSSSIWKCYRYQSFQRLNRLQQTASFGTVKASSLSSLTCGNLSLEHPSVKRYLKDLAAQQDNRNDVNLLRTVKMILEKQNELKELIAMGNDNAEFQEIAELDAENIKLALQELQNEFFRLVIPPDKLDYSDELIMEVSAGVGGQEAMLFTKELLDMYSNYSSGKGWQCDLIEESGTELGGLRHGSLQIVGPLVYKSLKFEGGVHRVQRIPKTEKAGRIHTSAATVAILPMPQDVDVVINPQDLKIETKRASGAGGQHVNKTESAIRITHLPSGIVVECQTQRSQTQNKTSAMKTLRAKLYQREVDKQVAKIHSSRKLQVGFGGRNEKIRTYNYVQDRVTDHRIGVSVYNLRDVLDGGDNLETIISSLQEYDVQEKLSELFK